MCEIFAIDSFESTTINYHLQAFFKHARRHPHGWGLALRNENGLWAKRDVHSATNCPLVKDLVKKDLSATSALAHIRFATIGRVSRVNCHPFILKDDAQRTWTLVHNGTLFNDALVAPYYPSRKGQTDSEAVLPYLLAALEKSYSNTQTQPYFSQFACLDRAISRLARGNKLNLAFNDGTFTYIHTNCATPSLYVHHDKGSVIFCTTPLELDADDESQWLPAARCRLLIYRQGALVYAGKEHDALFEDDKAVVPAEFAEAYYDAQRLAAKLAHAA